HLRRAYLSFNLHQTILQFTDTRSHRRELRAEIGAAGALRRTETPRNSLCNNFRLVVHRYKRSIRSTTPTIAESIAAPASPVAAVDAPQPSCTISTVSPTPESTESSARTE